MIALCLQELITPCNDCGSAQCMIFTALAGTMSDGSGSGKYANYANCRWIIAPGVERAVSFTFMAFNVESNYDFVSVSKCSDASCDGTELLAARLSGTQGLGQTYTSDSVLQVLFTADNSVTFGGFEASWVNIVSMLSFP